MPSTLGLGFKVQNTFSHLPEQQFPPLKASSKSIETKDEAGGFSNGCLLLHLSAISTGELGGYSGEKTCCLLHFSVSILLMREGALHPPCVIRMPGTVLAMLLWEGERTMGHCSQN